MLGRPVLNQLLIHGFAVTVLTRDANKSHEALSQHQSQQFKIKQVDYSSLDSLSQAVADHDAVVSTLSRPAQKDEEQLIDACLAAGVRRFIPSAFGGDMAVPWVREQPFWADKMVQEDYLLKRVEQSQGGLSYTMFTNGPIFDFILQMKLIINMAEKKINLYDGGDKLLSVTTKDTIGKAVSAALMSPADTRNKSLYIEGTRFNQRQLLKLAQELTPGQQWTTAEINTLPLWKQAQEKWAQGVRGPAAGPGFLLRGMFTEGFGGAFERTDNNLLGIQRMSDEEIKGLLSQYL